MRFDAAEAVAEAVLYEGYALYPYRASSTKNQVRWQFGVLVPESYATADSGETPAQQTECVVEPRAGARLHVRVRFLQFQARTVEAARGPGVFEPVARLDAGETSWVSFDEAVAHDVDVDALLADLCARERCVPFEVPAGRLDEPLRDQGGTIVGRMVRERWRLSGVLRLRAEPVDGPYGVLRLRVRVENATTEGAPFAGRDGALRRSLIASHVLLALEAGSFISSLEPPEWAASLVASCRNLHAFPVLAGEPGRHELVLSSPIILYDYPAIAPESPGDLFDATEIDEILALRTMALTDEEKREARATDARVAEIIDRVDGLPGAVLERLHGAIRYLDSPGGGRMLPHEPVAAPLRATPHAPEPGPADPFADVGLTPWWDPGADGTVAPDTDHVVVNGVPVARGSRVRLRPVPHRADAQDMFLAGRAARVEAVFFDVDEHEHLAVTLEDDPGADLLAQHGRYLYFSPDEVEPLEAGA